MWRKLAEIVEKYVHKGDKLYIEGQIRTRNYTDKKGNTRYITEIWAEKMEMLTPKPAAKVQAESPKPESGDKAGSAFGNETYDKPPF